jgi:hypothetical protein
MNDDPFAPLRGIRGARDAVDAINTKPRWISVVPVPTDAPAPPAVHPTLGAPSAIWTYRDTAGIPLAYMYRFEPKTFRPLTLWRGADGKLRWRWESLPCKRSLYGLWRLAERPSAPVLVCEGEGSADAGADLLPELVVEQHSLGISFRTQEPKRMAAL